MALQAAEMLAADLVLSDNESIAQDWQDQATAHQLQQSHVTVFSSMAHTQDQFVMVNVKAIEHNFPLRGELRVSPAAEKIQSGEIWLSQRAMDLLHVKLGETVNIADAAFTVTAKIEHDSNQELGFSGFSPTVIISQAATPKIRKILSNTLKHIHHSLHRCSRRLRLALNKTLNNKAVYDYVMPVKAIRA
ncbi:Uncharacterised protein [Mycobacteroides abscessus subsp. abscessus]|nr:Uncharacterised protein [Mycobacteroides abscessus subsp. abscessus]